MHVPLEAFFIGLGVLLMGTSYAVYKHYTHMPNVRLPKRLDLKPLDTFQFHLARDSSSGLLHLPACPPAHLIFEQALTMLFKIPRLTYNQVRYIRDLQYTFDLALSAYMQACFNEETHRLAAKLMGDMHVLASELYAVSRRLKLTMQVRFPRECDDPMLALDHSKQKYLRIGRRKSTREASVLSEGEASYKTADGVMHLVGFA